VTVCLGVSGLPDFEGAGSVFDEEDQENKFHIIADKMYAVEEITL